MKQAGPWRITFDTNPDDCNLSCIMCEDHSPFSTTQKDRIKDKLPRRRMDITLIKKILSDSKNSYLKEVIPSTMGEPLVYKQFEKIIEMCHEFDLKLNLTTNGTFPRKGVESWAKLLLPITSDIKISWNGATKATQEKIMIGTKWDKVLDNLTQFIKMRNIYAKDNKNYCSITLQMTFLETNLHELTDIVALGINLGVDRIKGHHLWAHFKEIENLSMRRNKDSIRRWNSTVGSAIRIANQNPLPNGKTIKLENIYILDEDLASEDLLANSKCPFLGKEAWVATDGKFNPCCAPDMLRRTLGDFGNVADRSVTEIWNSKEYQDLCDNYMQYKVCQKCNMRKTNVD